MKLINKKVISTKWFNNIIFKLVFYLFLTSMLPLLILGVVSNLRANDVIKEKIGYFTNDMLYERKKHVEMMMNDIEALIANVNGIDDIKAVLENDLNSENSYAKLATQAKIGYILSNYVNVKGLVSIDIFSNHGEHYHVGDTLDTSQINTVLKDNIYNNALKSEGSIYWEGITENVNQNSKHKQVISAVKVIKTLDKEKMSEKPLGILIVNYDINVFYEHFYNGDLTDADYMIIDDKKRIVYCSDRNKIGGMVDDRFINALNENKENFSYNLDNSNQYISNVKINKNNWRIISIVPEKRIIDQTSDITRNTYILILVCFILSVLFGILIFTYFVEPIKEITLLFTKIQDGTIDYRIRLKQHSSDEIGELIKWFNVFIEGLEQQRLTKIELIKAKEAAEIANKAKSEFFANMSHEIRTPLNALIGSADLLYDNGLNDNQKKLVNIIQNSSNLLLGIINGILDFSKIEAGKVILNNEKANLHNLINQTIEIITIQAQEKGLNIKVLINKEVPVYVDIDEMRLRQVLLNLLVNAVKFTKVGGISVKVIKEGGLEGDSSSMVRFEVTDTGIGIAKDNISKLFAPFVQADGTTTRKYGGTGLGLAISKSIVEMMGGEIGVTSTLGVGSTFWFRINMPLAYVLPLDENISSLQNHQLCFNQNIGVKKNQGELKVLIAEDNSINQMLILMQLKKIGLEGEIAENGEAAVKKVKVGDYDLILMDCQMPVMDGFEATMLIRKNEHGSKIHIPIIAMTANAMEGDKQRCLDCGMDDYLSKPIKIDLLNEKISKWIFEGNFSNF